MTSSGSDTHYRPHEMSYGDLSQLLHEKDAEIERWKKVAYFQHLSYSSCPSACDCLSNTYMSIVRDEENGYA